MTQEVGIHLVGQYSKSLRQYMGKIHFGYLITVCSEADKNCPSVFPGIGQRLHWSFEDPAGFEGSDDEKIEKFRKIRDKIEQNIKEWIKEN